LGGVFYEGQRYLFFFSNAKKRDNWVGNQTFVELEWSSPLNPLTEGKIDPYALIDFISAPKKSLSSFPHV
jgi:hypothetical protein